MTQERYPEPLGSRLRQLWMRYSHQSGWPGQPAWRTALQDSGLFGATLEASHTRAPRLPAETVIGLERTRATFLSHTEQNQAGFTADLQTLVMPGSHINLFRKPCWPWCQQPPDLSARFAADPDVHNVSDRG